MYTAPPSEDVQKCLWNECNIEFDDAEALYEHITTTHIGRKSAGTLSLECKWQGCSSKATKRDHLTSHMRVHINLKPHKCSVCAKSFKRPQDLKKHEKIHTEEHHVNHRHSKALTVQPDPLSSSAPSLTPTTTPLAKSLAHSATPTPNGLSHPNGHSGVPQLANFPYAAFPGYGFHPAMMYGIPAGPNGMAAAGMAGAMPGMHPHQPQLDLAQLVAYQQQLTAQQQAGMHQMNPQQMGAYGMMYAAPGVNGQAAYAGGASGAQGGAGMYAQAGMGFAPYGYGMYPGMGQQQPQQVQGQQHVQPAGVQSMYPSLGGLSAPMASQPVAAMSAAGGAVSLYPSLDGLASQPAGHFVKAEDHPSPSARSAHSSSLHSPAPSGAASQSSVSPRTNSTTLSPPGLSYSPSPERESDSSLGMGGLGLSRGKKRERGFEDAAGQFLGDLRKKKFTDVEQAGHELDALHSLLFDPQAQAPNLAPTRSQASSASSVQWDVTKDEVDSVNQLLLSLGQQMTADDHTQLHTPHFDPNPAAFPVDHFNPVVPNAGQGLYPSLPRATYGQLPAQAQHAMYPPASMATGGVHPGNFDYATVRLSKPAPAPTLVNDVRLPTYQNVNRLGRAAPSAYSYRDTPMEVDDDESEHGGKGYASSLRSTSVEEGPKLPPLVGAASAEKTTLPPIRDLLRHASSSSVGSSSMSESVSSHSSSSSSGRPLYPSLGEPRRPVSAGGVDRLASSVRLFGMRSPTADLDEHAERADEDDDVLEPKSEDSDELTAGEEDRGEHKHKRSRTELSASTSASSVVGPVVDEAEAKAREVRERRMFTLRALIVYANATVRQQMMAEKWEEVRREGKGAGREVQEVKVEA